MIDHRAALRILVEMAPELRRVGVESFSIDDHGGLRDVRLRPPDPPQSDAKGSADEPSGATHPLDDPDTFGGVVPKRKPMLWDDDEERQS